MSLYLPGCIYPLIIILSNQSIYLSTYLYVSNSDPFTSMNPQIFPYPTVSNVLLPKNMSSKAISMVPLSDYILGRAVPLIYIYIYTYIYIYICMCICIYIYRERYKARIIRVMSQLGGLKPYYTILSRPFLSPQLHPEEWDDHRKLDFFHF